MNRETKPFLASQEEWNNLKKKVTKKRGGDIKKKKNKNTN